MAMCDCCGSQCSAHELQQLVPSYQVDGIVDICPACRKAADGEKARLLAGIAPAMQGFIRARSARPPGRRLSLASALWWLGRLGAPPA